MRVRAVPGLGDRYVGSVEYMGEGRVLVDVKAEGWGSDRSMVCYELDGGRPLREGESAPFLGLLELGASAVDGSVRYVTCFPEATPALLGPLPPQALSPGRGIRLRGLEGLRRLADGPRLGLIMGYGASFRLRLSGRDLMVEREGMRGSPEAYALGPRASLLLGSGRVCGLVLRDIGDADLSALADAGLLPSPWRPPGSQPLWRGLRVEAPPGRGSRTRRARRAVAALSATLPAGMRPAFRPPVFDPPDARPFSYAHWRPLGEGPWGPALHLGRPEWPAMHPGRLGWGDGRARLLSLRSGTRRAGELEFQGAFGPRGDSLDVILPCQLDLRGEAAADVLVRALSATAGAMGATWGCVWSQAGPLPDPPSLEGGLPTAVHWANWLSPALSARLGPRAAGVASGEAGASFDGRLLRLGRRLLDAYDPADEALRLRAQAALLGR